MVERNGDAETFGTVTKSRAGTAPSVCEASHVFAARLAKTLSSR